MDKHFRMMRFGHFLGQNPNFFFLPLPLSIKVNLNHDAHVQTYVNNQIQSIHKISYSESNPQSSCSIYCSWTHFRAKKLLKEVTFLNQSCISTHKKY